MLVYLEFVSDLSNRSFRETGVSKPVPVRFPFFRSCRALEFCLSWLPLMMKIWIGGYVYLEASRTSVGVCFVFVQNFKFREIKNCGVLKNTELFSAGCEVSSFL